MTSLAHQGSHVHAIGPLLLAASLVLAGCAKSGPPSETPAAVKDTQVSKVFCPSLSGSGSAAADLSALFGVSRDLGARLERMVRLAEEIERTAIALDAQTRDVCSAIARDLDPTPAPAMSTQHPCEVAGVRWVAFQKRLGPDARLSVSITGVSCGLTRDTLAKCAGECLTGVAGVESAVTCNAKARDSSPGVAALCRGSFDLPNASKICGAQCATRALRLSACSAQVDVRIEGTSAPVDAIVDGLRQELPKLAGLAGEILPAAKKLGADVPALVDDVAASIDAMTRGGNLDERSVVVGAIVAGCFAPKLADALRASAALERSVAKSVTLQSAITTR